MIEKILLFGSGLVLGIGLVEIFRELRRIRRALEHNRLMPVGFRIKETNLSTGEISMSPFKAGVNLRILDNGKGVLYTLTPVNKKGESVPWDPNNQPITATSSAPGTLNNAVLDPGDDTATPPRPADTTGLVFVATVVKADDGSVVDAMDIVMTFTDTLTTGTVISTAAPAVDVEGDDSPAGFTITESAL